MFILEIRYRWYVMPMQPNSFLPNAPFSPFIPSSNEWKPKVLRFDTDKKENPLIALKINRIITFSLSIFQHIRVWLKFSFLFHFDRFSLWLFLFAEIETMEEPKNEETEKSEYHEKRFAWVFQCFSQTVTERRLNPLANKQDTSLFIGLLHRVRHE